MKATQEQLEYLDDLRRTGTDMRLARPHIQGSFGVSEPTACAVLTSPTPEGLAAIVEVADPSGPLPGQIAYLRAAVWAAMMEIENGFPALAFHRLASAHERTRLE